MSIINHFIPKNIKFPDSKYNKNISVLLYGKTATLLSGDLIESGDIMSQIWGKGAKDLLPKSFVPKSVLLLGLGGGSNAMLIRKKFPKAKIIGVDIDPVMVDLGRKYFGLGKIKNLEIVIADAYEFVLGLPRESHYDLILLDCYLGKSFPEKLERMNFLKKLKNQSQHTLINRLWWPGVKEDTCKFMSKLEKHFFFIKTHTRTNVIISLV